MYRESWVEINLDALKKNIQHIQKNTTKDCICVIKANGYGSGDQYVIQTAIELGIHFFAVSSLDEAIVLRNEGCKEKILILGYVNPKDIQLCLDYDLSCTIVSLDWLKEIITHKPTDISLQMKVDTGMNRIGIKTKEECLEALTLCKDNNFNLEGIFTHFACSDDPQQTMTKEQYKKFTYILDYLSYDFKYIHCNNSDAILSFDDAVSNFARLGISMYGINSHTQDLSPVFSLFSTISCIKEVEEGQSISYGATYTTNKNEIIATLPIGYADGWLRKNQGRYVYVNGELSEIVGRICMDQCMIRTNQFYPIGTRVELFGRHIAIQDVAKELETIPYEILTNLSERLTRIYIKDGNILSIDNARLNRSKK